MLLSNVTPKNQLPDLCLINILFKATYKQVLFKTLAKLYIFASKYVKH
jgi:hypothetical protein